MGKRKQKSNTLRHLSYIERRGGEAKLQPPSNLDVFVVGTGAAGTPKSAFFDMSHFRYLFNCGEGTQRVAFEHKMRLSKLKNIFITHRNWENIGGLPGMGLTLEAIGLPEITIHGPPNVEKMALSRGLSLLNFKVDKRDISEGTYEDSAMKIDFIPIYPQYTSESDIESTEPASKKQRPNEEDMSVIYFCQPHPKPRALMIEKAAALGVPRGPALGKLKSGETITLENGTKITPEEVLSKPEVSVPFLVLEVPTVDYLESFLSNATLKDLQKKTEREAPKLIVHFTPQKVLHLPQYQEWMNEFHSTTQHLVLNSEGSAVSQLLTYKIQSQLNLIHPEIFPLLPHQSAEQETLPEIKVDQRVVSGRTGLKFAVREGQNRPRGFYSENCPEVDNELSLAELDNVEGFHTALAKTKERLTKAVDQGLTGGDYPEILFLGTGSAVPNKIRNVSAILVHTSSDQCILMDSGEGTYGQLCHHYGKQTPEVLRRLNAVFISHLHADHYMGLIGVIHGREEAFEAVGQKAPPLTLLVTWNYFQFVQTTDPDILPLKDKINVVPIEWFVRTNMKEKEEECQQVVKDLGFKEINFVKMEHAQSPFGVAITLQDGYKLAYSGDSMPCKDFITIGEDCDLLIHEATMEDELLELAVQKKHSTTSQAIEVGMKMRAKFILLTHFSQRYAKVPWFSPSFTDKVGIAFDNMKVRARDLHLLPLLIPSLKALFSEDIELIEKRAQKRRRTEESKRQANDSESENSDTEEKDTRAAIDI